MNRVVRIKKRATTGSLSEIQAELRVQADRLEELTRRVGQQIETLADLRRRIAREGKLERRLLEIRMDLDALKRNAFLRDVELPYPFRLTAQRFRGLSQNAEDGITLAVLREIGFGVGRFVEIGAGLNGGNSGFLALECGWSGLMIEARKYAVKQLQVLFNLDRVQVIQEWVTRGNVNTLVGENGLGGEIDLLSIDLDGNDYWVWEAVDACRPRLVIVEYNAVFGGERAVVVPYADDFDRRKFDKQYFGASLPALSLLGRRKGYRLVAVEPQGVNAYFLRDGLAPGIPELDPRQAFRLKLKRQPEYGDPLDPGSKMVLLRDLEADLYAYIDQKRLPLVEVTA